MHLKFAFIKKRLMFSAFLIFLALIGCEVFLSFYYNNKSKEEISVTQLFTSIPLNKDNKTFITISPVRRWEEEFAVRGALFNCSIFNNTKHDFKEWKNLSRRQYDLILSLDVHQYIDLTPQEYVTKIISHINIHL